MKNRILRLAALALTSVSLPNTLVRAEDGNRDALVPMKLSTVVVQDFSADTLQPTETTRATEFPVAETRNPPVERIVNSDRTPIDRSRTERLQRLNRPISQLGVDGLSLAGDVSRLSFTSDDERFVTASHLSPLNSLECRTTYPRRPLYFEQPGLERCGDSQCITCQGILTNPHCLAKFFIDTALAPFRMVRTPPWKPVVATAK